MAYRDDSVAVSILTVVLRGLYAVHNDADGILIPSLWQIYL